jgi:acyl carrier protein
LATIFCYNIAGGIMNDINLICEIFSVEQSDFKLNQKLESLFFWDSVGKLQFISYVMNNFQQEISENEMIKFNTLQELVDFINQFKNGKK